MIFQAEASTQFPRGLKGVTSKKWLNIVLDINGILCKCVERRLGLKDSVTNHINLSVHSPKFATIVGPKAVYVRPGFSDFISFVNEFANILVWSSMKNSTAMDVVKYLFTGLPMPSVVLSQEDCERIQTSRRTYLKYPDGDKPIFLKTFSSTLFGAGSIYNVNNTILIDDSPEKSICNETGNAVFLKSWIEKDDKDDYLMSVLAPWLSNLVKVVANGNLRNYVESNRIGVPPMSDDDPLFNHILEGMAVSTRNVGTVYDVCGVSNPRQN